MITTDKILAHKVHGKSLILLKQVGNSYFVLLAQVTRVKKGLFSAFTTLGSFSPDSSLKILAQREISTEEAQAIYTAFTSTPTDNATSSNTQTTVLALSGSTTPVDQTINSDVLLLAGSTADEKPVTQKVAFKPTVSPYFPTKDIFLSVQKTRAPATI
ncbi:MAG: hypothetical protein K9M11_01155 [Candidatus Pacebacteria bacterium]|nr:hypothetical protein [Candidatus Paceibacterota bacterium]